MNITKRFLCLIFFGVPLLGVGYILNHSLTFFVLYNCMIVCLLLIDYVESQKKILFTLERRGSNKLSIYEEEEILFNFYNRGEFPLYIEMIDEIPEFHFKCDNKIIRGMIRPNEKGVLKYTVIPTKRGAFVFRNIHLKVTSRFKLYTQEYKINLRREYKVYPNLKNLSKYRLGIQRNPLLKQGQKNLKIQGKGTAFESLREYVTGDEYRKINWQASARANKPIVNEYEPEKNQHVYCFIDTGRTMSYTIRGYRKLDLAVNTALVLSDMINQNGDVSGLITFNTEVKDMIMPGKGVEHRNKIMEALYHVDYTKNTSNYEEVFQYFKKKERHRSIIFIFTDFDTPEESEEIMKVLPLITRTNIVVIVLIKNEDIDKIVKEKSKDTGHIFSKTVALELLEDRAKTISILNKKNVFCIECPPEKLQLQVINKYIEIKNKTYL